MKVYSWEEILKGDLNHIYLFGYGSLLNTKTHHNEHNKLIPASTDGYKRSFSLSYSKDKCENEGYKERFKKTAIEMREEYENKENILTYIKNSGSLTVEEKSGYSLNGLLLKIEKKDFESYAQRENAYKLFEIKVNYFNKEDDLGDEEKIFILIANAEILEKTSIYYLYQKSCRVGAYNQSVQFGEFYDETTYSFDGMLAYEELNKNIFKIGREFIVKQNLITLNRFEGLKEEIIKADGQTCIILSNNKYLAEVLIKATNKKIWLDTSDLAIL